MNNRKSNAFVIIAPEGKVVGTGNIVAPDNKLLLDLSDIKHRKEYIEKNPIFSKKLPPVCKLKGAVAVLSYNPGSTPAQCPPDLFHVLFGDEGHQFQNLASHWAQRFHLRKSHQAAQDFINASPGAIEIGVDGNQGDPSLDK